MAHFGSDFLGFFASSHASLPRRFIKKSLLRRFHTAERVPLSNALSFIRLRVHAIFDD